MDELKILFVTDKEAGPEKRQTFTHTLESSLPAASHEQLRVVTNTPPPIQIDGNVSMTGHNRQQYVMSWADNFTSAKYVGFIDTNTMFSTRVLSEDLFVDDRPRVHGDMLGKTGFWEVFADNHRNFTGFYDIMQAMSYFPVVIKTTHLPVIRAILMKGLDCKTFGEVFQKILNRTIVEYGMYSYSQFSLMMNILYRERYDNYVYHTCQRFLNWNMAWETNPTLGKIPDEDLIPYLHFALHWSYTLDEDKTGGINGAILKSIATPNRLMYKIQ